MNASLCGHQLVKEGAEEALDAYFFALRQTDFVVNAAANLNDFLLLIWVG